MARFRTAFQGIANMPNAGIRRDDLLATPLRSMALWSDLIFRRPDVDPVEIVRIVSGYRDLDALFDETP